MGEFLAAPAFDGEQVLVADLDMGDIVRAKFDFDPVGHYARPDVLRMTVDEREKRAVTWLGDERGDVPEGGDTEVAHA
jgi:nitrilase